MNKIIVSIVFAVVLIVGINKIADVIFFVEKPENSAYQVATVTTATSTAYILRNLSGRTPSW